MSQFRLKVELDPDPEDRTALEKWPRQPLIPDIATIASGWIALEFDSRPILYESGELVPPTHQGRNGDPLNTKAARIGDYVIIFLERLLEACRHLRDGQPHLAGFGDSPACLVLQGSDGHVCVSYREDPGAGDVAQARPAEEAFLSAVKSAASHYLETLYTINPALHEHPDVAAIRNALNKV